MGAMSAVLAILGAISLAYLVRGNEELFFGQRVNPTNKIGPYIFAWVSFVIAGAQLYALAINDRLKIWLTTVLRIVTIVAAMLLGPNFEWRVSINVFSVFHLCVAVTILALSSENGVTTSSD